MPKHVSLSVTQRWESQEEYKKREWKKKNYYLVAAVEDYTYFKEEVEE